MLLHINMYAVRWFILTKLQLRSVCCKNEHIWKLLQDSCYCLVRADWNTILAAQPLNSYGHSKVRYVYKKRRSESYCSDDRGSIPRRRNYFLLVSASKLALGPSSPLSNGYPGQGREANLSLQYSAEKRKCGAAEPRIRLISSLTASWLMN
jgi:hypothetical protein